MSHVEITVQGTLNPDGTLQLDAMPTLSPGRVTVVLRQETTTEGPAEGWWPYLQRIRAEREEEGYPFMDEAQMQAHVEWLRGDDDRLDELMRQMQQEQTEEQP